MLFFEFMTVMIMRLAEMNKLQGELIDKEVYQSKKVQNYACINPCVDKYWSDPDNPFNKNIKRKL